MSFVSSLNPDFVVQTLGALVQAYASLLAIAGAFFVFLIERTRADKVETERRLLRSEERFIQLIQTIVKDSEAVIIPIDVSDVREHLKNGNFDWVKNEITIGFSLLHNAILYYELEDYIQNYDKYAEMQKRTGLWVFNNFRWIFAYYLIMLIFLVIELNLISHKGIILLTDYLFTILLTASVVGFVLFMIILEKILIVETEK